MYEDVLVATDGSDPAALAVDRAIDIAATFDATLHALSVVDRAAGGAPLGTYAAGAVQSLEAQSEELVDDVASDAAARGVDCEGHVLLGSPSEVIRQFVDDHDVDLVVVGTHGRTGVKHALLGSVAERVVRTVDAPVLTVPAED